MEVFVVRKLGIAVLILTFTQLQLMALEEPAKTRGGPGGTFFLAAIERTSGVRSACQKRRLRLETKRWSGKYFKPGSRYYGRTRVGKFMTELDALDSGYLPAGGTGH